MGVSRPTVAANTLPEDTFAEMFQARPKQAASVDELFTVTKADALTACALTTQTALLRLCLAASHVPAGGAALGAFRAAWAHNSPELDPAMIAKNMAKLPGKSLTEIEGLVKKVMRNILGKVFASANSSAVTKELAGVQVPASCVHAAIKIAAATCAFDAVLRANGDTESFRRVIPSSGEGPAGSEDQDGDAAGPPSDPSDDDLRDAGQALLSLGKYADMNCDDRSLSIEFHKTGIDSKIHLLRSTGAPTDRSGSKSGSLRVGSKKTQANTRAAGEVGGGFSQRGSVNRAADEVLEVDSPARPPARSRVDTVPPVASGTLGKRHRHESEDEEGGLLVNPDAIHAGGDPGGGVNDAFEDGVYGGT